MFKPKFTITNSIANTLTTIERARGFLEAATLSDEWVAKMQNKALILEAHHTTHRFYVAMVRESKLFLIYWFRKGRQNTINQKSRSL